MRATRDGMSAREPVHRTPPSSRAPRRADVYAVVTDFAAYPRLFPELKATRVVLDDSGNVVRVEFRAAGRDRRSATSSIWPADARRALTVDWTFVEGEIVTRLGGRLALRAGGRRHAPSTTPSRSTSTRRCPASSCARSPTGSSSASLPNMFASIEREVRRASPSGRDAGSTSPRRRVPRYEEAQPARGPRARVVDADARASARDAGQGRRRPRRKSSPRRRQVVALVRAA